MVQLAFKHFDVRESEAPKETPRHLLIESVSLAEGAFDAEKGEAEITIITAGFNTSKSNFYPAEVLRRDFAIFEGLKMFTDHPTEREHFERPEGSVRDWVANVKNVSADGGGKITGTAVITDEAFRAKLRLLAEKKLLGEMGVSIRAVVIGHEDEVQGVPVLMIDELLRGRSVDFVTTPGAGGRVNTFESDQEIDVDLIPAAEIIARRPDVVMVCESNQEGSRNMDNEKKVLELEQETKKLREDAEAGRVQAQKDIDEMTKDRDEKAKALDEQTQKVEAKEKETHVAEAQIKIAKLITESKLPDPAKERLTEQFKGAEKVDGVEEAIKAETDYLAKIAPNRATGMGNNGDSEKKVDLAESFQRMGLSEEEAKIAGAGRAQA